MLLVDVTLMLYVPVRGATKLYTCSRPLQLNPQVVVTQAPVPLLLKVFVFALPPPPREITSEHGFPLPVRDTTLGLVILSALWGMFKEAVLVPEDEGENLT